MLPYEVSFLVVRLPPVLPLVYEVVLGPALFAVGVLGVGDGSLGGRLFGRVELFDLLLPFLFYFGDYL